MAAPGFCGVCRRNVRGGYATHAGTRAHRTALIRAEKGRGNRAVGSKAAIRRANAGRTLRTNVDLALAALTLRVRTHRRRRPNDGPARSVKVTRHYRRRPVPTVHRMHKLWHAADGTWWVLSYANGDAAGMRRATRREVASRAFDVLGAA